MFGLKLVKGSRLLVLDFSVGSWKKEKGITLCLSKREGFYVLVQLLLCVEVLL